MRVTVRWMWVLVCVAVLYTGFVFYRRWSDNHELAGQAAAAEADRARKIVDQYGNGEMKILQFYLAGDRICYGVANAKSVRIEPGITDIVPSLSRCVEVKTKSTEYKLIATDSAGREQIQAIHEGR